MKTVSNSRNQKSNTSRKAGRRLVSLNVDLTTRNAAFLRKQCKELGISRELLVSHLMVDELIRVKTGKIPLLLEPKDLDAICDAVSHCLNVDCGGGELDTPFAVAAIWRTTRRSFVKKAVKRRNVNSVEEALAVRADNDRCAKLLNYLSRFMPKQPADTTKGVAHA